MTTVESLLSWEGSKLEKLSKQSGDVTKLINTFRDFVTTVGEERKRFSNERSVLSQQIQVAELNTQQKNSEMERQIFELTAKLQLESQLKSSLECSESSRQTELRELREAVERLDSEKNALGQSLRDNKAASDNLKHELEDAVRRLQYKEEETKRLNTEWDQISQKEASVSKLGAELRAKLSDVENREVSLKYREERLGQEKDIVSTQNNWLTEELSAKSSELSKLRQSNSESVSKLQSKVAELSEECSFLKTSNTTLKTHCTKQDKKVGELVNRLQERETEYLANIDNIRLQLNKQERLTELYNKNCDEYKGKIQELTSAVEEMQSMLRSAEESQHLLEQHCETEQSKSSGVIKELETKVTTLQNELDNANDLLHCSHSQTKGDIDISQLSSTAVTVGGMLKSGMSITQMYTAYVEATEALALEKDKNRLQSQYLDQILKEIEEKAPLLQQQRLDYENSLLNQDNLSNKLEKALAEIEHYRAETEQAVLSTNGLKRENERHRIRIKDLNQQVQVLLKEVEETRQGRSSSRTSSRTSSPALSSSRVSSSSQVISEQLVNFHSIAELQSQNSKLLAVVRELSEEQERRETEDDDPKVVELRAKLESSVVQIKEVKAAHQRQVEMVEAVARQRDMYRVLLAQAGHNMGPAEDSKEVKKESEHELALKELQKEFTEYKIEKKEYLSLLQDQLETLRNEHNTLQTERTKLSSKLDFAEEKYKTLEGTHNLTKADVTHQKSKQQEMSAMVTRLQMTNERTQNEAIGNKDEIKKLRQSLEAQKKTVDLLRMTEVKQRSQNEALMRETRTQNMLLSNLQTIQNNLERQEFEQKERMEKRVTDLQSELTEARRKAHSAELRFKTAEAMQACQIKELKASLDREKCVLAERQSTIDSVQAEYDKTLAELASVRTQLNTAQFDQSQRVEPAQHHDDDIDETIAAQASRLREQSQKMTKLQHTIIELTSREESLQEQVKLAKQHAQQYKEISEAHEQALTELQTSEASVRSAHDQLLGQNQEEVLTLRTQLRESKESKECLQSELDEINTKGSSELRELNAALKRTQVQLEEARQKEEAARSLEGDMKTQFKKLDSMYHTSQNNLTDKTTECELLESKKKELEEKLDDMQQKQIEATETMSSVEKKLEDEQQVWSVEKRSLQTERDNLKQRSDDLQQQNALLHTQLNKLSIDVVELQKMTVSEGVVPEGKSGDKTTEELWEIIRYVRREKEILNAKLQVTESEIVRYKNRCEQLEKQVEEGRLSLEEERERTESSVQSAEQHSEILSKVEQAQALAEEVAVLTQDKHTLAQSLATLRQQVSQYEKQVQPLVSENKDLTDKVDILQGEKESLVKEVERWGVRCNELIEQCNKVDVKEFSKLQTISNTLRSQLKKCKEDHATEVAELQEKCSSMSEESERISGEKRALLGNINSIKAESTRTKMELTTVSSELKSANTLITQHKADLERAKQAQVDIAKENADIKKEMEDKETTHQQAIDKNQDVIAKLRNLAKNYKNKFKEAEAAARPENADLAADMEKMKKLSTDTLRKARQEHEALTAKISELEGEIEEKNVSNKLLTEAMETERKDSSEKLELCTADKAAIQTKLEELETSVTTLTEQLASKVMELAELQAKTSCVHAETNTDLHRHDQQTNTDYYRTDDTPTASVKPTAITASGTPTAAVRPTSITPDAPPRMATVQPTTSHITTSSTSGYTSNQPTQVSSSSVQNQAEADTPSITSHQRPETSNQRPETSHQRPGSSTFHSNKRSRDEDDEQPGPSTKIAMVTSSAHIQHQEASCDGSEVSQSTPIFPSTSSHSPSSHSPSSHSAGRSHGGALVSSSESVAPSRPVYNLDPVTSSEVTRGEMRSLSESNEAMPSLPTLEPPSTDPASLSVADENILEVDEDADVPQVIEIASDSDEVSEEEKEDDEEDDYSGLEDVEEDSRALQFSFVQSSGPDPVHDVLSADEALDMQEEEDSNEASEAAPSSTISLSTADTPWAHIAGNTEAAPAASSSSTNVRGIRRIKRQPKKE